jgi:hypothetical protein
MMGTYHQMNLGEEGVSFIQPSAVAFSASSCVNVFSEFESL